MRGGPIWQLSGCQRGLYRSVAQSFSTGGIAHLVLVVLDGASGDGNLQLSRFAFFFIAGINARECCHTSLV